MPYVPIYGMNSASAFHLSQVGKFDGDDSEIAKISQTFATMEIDQSTRTTDSPDKPAISRRSAFGLPR
jgi:hypothetical protein